MATQTHPPTLAGIAAMMTDSPISFTAEVGALLSYIHTQHQPPITCAECQLIDGPCHMLDLAHAAGIAWLMQLVDER